MEVAPDGVVQRLKQSGYRVPIAKAAFFERYNHHLAQRESIRIDAEALEYKVVKHGKKESNRSQSISKQYQRIRDSLTCDEQGYWHRPQVSPFHTITGRDQVLGSSIVQLSKNSWPDILSPPAGSVYVLLDYEQQEPLIAASLAGCYQLMAMYERGDIYSQLADEITGAQVSREAFKTVLISRLNGARVKQVAEKLNLSNEIVRQWFIKLKQQLNPIDSYLNHQVYLGRRHGVLRSQDWQHFVSPNQSDLSIRNWSLQSTGADILRRACLNLDDNNIPLLLTNHDSFLVRLDEANFDDQLERAIKALHDASVDVLKCFSLKVKVELTLLSKP